jgi:dimethylglycine catabolism B
VTARADLCVHCPKLCSFACPVSEQTGREALTPWGKVSLGALAPANAAMELAGCTGCDRCVQHCEHHNDVPDILYKSRALAVRAGAAPKAWTDLAHRFAVAGHGRGEDLAAARAELPESSGAALLFPGCDQLAQVAQVVQHGRTVPAGAQLVQNAGAAGDALFAAARLNARLGLTPPGVLCCGRELREAGHPELAEAHAARIRGLLPRKPHLVFLSPSCARHARDAWPGAQVEHITTYLSRALVGVPEVDRPPPLEDVLYKLHDPCALARGLSELTAPRALLAAACGDFREPLRTGTETSCCGAEGLLPRTLPAVAAKMAESRREELDGPIATASPACSTALRATEIVTIVARWLAQGADA